MVDLEKQRRERMVAEQILARGVRDKRVLDAMSKVSREAFVPENVRWPFIFYSFDLVNNEEG